MNQNIDELDGHFDFVKYLGEFDKKGEFGKIKENDTVDPKDRLVYFNRKPKLENQSEGQTNICQSSSVQKNYKNTEMVLSDSIYQPRTKNKNKNVFFTESGIYVPTIDKNTMINAETITVNEMGPNQSQLFENGGRSICLMAIKAIGGPRRLRPDNHNTPPVIVLLVGNNKAGIYGLCAGRHLASRGCEVICLLVGNQDSEFNKDLLEQYKYTQYSGVKMINSIQKLPNPLKQPIDLIIDGLLGYEYSINSISLQFEQQLINELISWVNNSQTPALSIDLPAGLLLEKGSIVTSNNNSILPKWTIALGAPQKMVQYRHLIGELFLGDIGIPNKVWERVGISSWQPPFGATYLIRLDFIEE
ncbi:YjeF N-terminal domain-like protein [Neoconidiobolus thromboides FSU 785]|nr:YjeF N-terminal domain-like protein [Neoconidiobolus thromboides FSU 785]